MLRHTSTGSGEDHRKKRIRSLENLLRRIESGGLLNEEGARTLLLEMSRRQGDSSPESSTIADSLLALIERDGTHFEKILASLKANKEEEQRTFLVLSKLVLRVDYNKKKEAIRPLVNFLTTSDSVNRVATKEVYDCLVELGNQRLSLEIVREIKPYLDSIDPCSIVFSVQLCSKFGGQDVLPQMLNVLEKSLKDYSDGNSTIIEREICDYIRRVGGLQLPKLLLALIKKRSNQTPVYASEALAKVLDIGFSSIEYVYEWLHDEHDAYAINWVLRAFVEMKTKMKTSDISKLLQSLQVKWWFEYPVWGTLEQLLVKNRNESKPILLEMMKKEEVFEFAIRCLRDIGVSRDELSGIFTEPLMHRIYHHFYKEQENLKDFDVILKKKSSLSENLRGNTSLLEHLVISILTGFNFVVMNLAPLKRMGIDIIGYYPETFDLFVIGCTTGVLNNDLAKMDAAVKRMCKEIAEPTLQVAPIVVVTSDASIAQADEQYASHNGIILLKSENLETLMEMLTTSRKPIEAIAYVKSMVPIAS